MNLEEGLKELRGRIDDIQCERLDYDHYMIEGKEEALAQVDLLLVMVKEKE